MKHKFIKECSFANFIYLKNDEQLVNDIAKYLDDNAKDIETDNEVQNLDEDLKTALYKAIFFQRKLKSQKFLVGKCTFEPKKPRCPVSHFDFEEFVE